MLAHGIAMSPALVRPCMRMMPSAMKLAQRRWLSQQATAAAGKKSSSFAKKVCLRHACVSLIIHAGFMVSDLQLHVPLSSVLIDLDQDVRSQI